MTREEIRRAMDGIDNHALEMLEKSPTDTEKLLCEAIMALTRTVRLLSKLKTE